MSYYIIEMLLLFPEPFYCKQLGWISGERPRLSAHHAEPLSHLYGMNKKASPVWVQSIPHIWLPSSPVPASPQSRGWWASAYSWPASQWWKGHLWDQFGSQQAKKESSDNGEWFQVPTEEKRERSVISQMLINSQQDTQKAWQPLEHFCLGEGKKIRWQRRKTKVYMMWRQGLLILPP